MRFPLEYAVELSSESGRAGLLTAPDHADIAGGAPAEFGGRDDWWSPEQLLLSAASLCLMATFHAFAARDGLAIEGYRSRALGTVNNTASGLAFTHIAIEADVTVAPADTVRALAIFDRAKRRCIVSNSLKTPVEASIDVHVSGSTVHA